ncbi:MAG: succinate dehydrogenase cytochrome b subunit [Candidatus Sericytochromatia bacterium]
MQQAEKQAAKPGALAAVLSIFNTTLGQKVVTGLTGLGLVGFLVAHLAGNLTLFGGAEAFNGYAHKLEALGPLLYAMEIGLITIFVFHIFFAISVTAQNKGARKQKYVENRPAGKPSRRTVSSQTMIYTGIVLGIFTIVHVWMFKFGPGPGQGYAAELHGVPARDLYRLVVERFKDPWIMGAYAAVMLLLGVHVRHGFWSAFQSLGGYHPRYTPLIYSLGVLVAVLFAVGFLVLPVYIYFFAALPATV